MRLLFAVLIVAVSLAAGTVQYLDSIPDSAKLFERKNSFMQVMDAEFAIAKVAKILPVWQFRMEQQTSFFLLKESETEAKIQARTKTKIMCIIEPSW